MSMNAGGAPYRQAASITGAAHFVLLMYALCVAANVACVRRSITAAAAVNPVPPDNSWTDLKPGDHLRITLPLAGTARGLDGARTEIHDGSLSVTSTGVVGYRNVNYLLTGSADGRVRLKFVSAETSVNGKTTQDAAPPALPFPLPRGRNYMRLLYMIRLSSSDHNMAIVAAKQTAALDDFTGELKKTPGVCGQRGPVFCAWVPYGVAVRRED